MAMPRSAFWQLGPTLALVGVVLVMTKWFPRVRVPAIRAALAIALALVLFWGTSLNLRIWRDDITLYRRGVETAPENAIISNNLADAYMKAGRFDEALPLLEKAIRINPGYGLAYYNLARYHQAVGNYAEAEYWFSISDRLYPR